MRDDDVNDLLTASQLDARREEQPQDPGVPNAVAEVAADVAIEGLKAGLEVVAEGVGMVLSSVVSSLGDLS